MKEPSCLFFSSIPLCVFLFFTIGFVPVSLFLSFSSLSCACCNMWRVSFQNTISIWEGKCFLRLYINIQPWVLLAQSISLLLFKWWTPYFRLFFLWHWQFLIFVLPKHVLSVLWDTACAKHAHTHTVWKWLYLHVTPGLVIQHAQRKMTAVFLPLRCYDAMLPTSIPPSPRLLRDPSMLLSPSTPLSASSLLTPFPPSFSFLTPPHIFVCHSHHLQQQSVALFFFSLSPSSPVIPVTVVADRQFLRKYFFFATSFISVSFSLTLSPQGCFWKNCGEQRAVHQRLDS